MNLDLASINSAAASFLLWIGQAVLFGTLLAAMTWLLLRLIGRRISPAMHAVFWLIVLVKFVLPIGPAWNYSLATTLTSASRAVRTIVDQPAATATQQPDVKTAIIWDATDDSARASAAPTATATAAPAKAAIAALVYLSIVALIGAARLIAYARFARRARTYAVADESVHGMVIAACRTLGVRRLPDVRISPDAPAPFVFGFINPMLVLSPRQLVRPDELEAVILHEVAHLRRGDLFVRSVQWLAGTLLFFWPVVAWVNRRIDLARETACDEWALRHGRLSAGAYARCLLSAIHPLRRSGLSYRPAAMAANVSTVERRIEMILSSPVRTRRLAAGLPVAVIALAWAGFVLTGIARAEDPKPAADQQQPQQVFVTAEGDEPGNVNVKIITNDQGENGKFVWTTDGSPSNVNVKVLRDGVPTAEELAAFLAAHPTADANADGQLSRSERSAYLTALAMHDQAGVLQRFPKSDTNGDAQLSADEAAQLVTGGMFFRKIEGPARADGVKSISEDVIVTRFHRGDAKPPMDCLNNSTETATWLVENIQYAPPATEVAQYVETVESAPFTAMLKRHPEADTNGDGKLSAEEREAFFKVDRMNVDAMLLKHFPEADTNGDGVLSKDELRAIKGRHVFIKQNDTANGSQSESLRVNGVEGGKEILILKTEETSETSTSDNK